MHGKQGGFLNFPALLFLFMRENRMKTGFAGCSKPTAHNCRIFKKGNYVKIPIYRQNAIIIYMVV